MFSLFMSVLIRSQHFHLRRTIKAGRTLQEGGPSPADGIGMGEAMVSAAL